MGVHVLEPRILSLENQPKLRYSTGIKGAAFRSESTITKRSRILAQFIGISITQNWATSFHSHYAP